MDWDKAKEIEVWFTGHKVNVRNPDFFGKEIEYKILDSGLKIAGIEEGKIHFFPNHRIRQVVITP